MHTKKPPLTPTKEGDSSPPSGELEGATLRGGLGRGFLFFGLICNMETGIIFWQESNNPQDSTEDSTAIEVTSSPVLEDSVKKEPTVQAETIQIDLRPTAQQIRYRETQRESRLLVGGSRYMKPITEIHLISSVDINTKKLGLPYREKVNNNTDWLTIVLLLGLVLFASVKNSFSKYLKHLMQSIFNYSTAHRMFQEKNNSIFHASLRLEIFHYIIVSVFLYQLAVHYRLEFQFDKFSLFLMCLALLVVYYATKIVLYRFWGLLIERQPEINEYLFNMSNFNRIVGIFIFPVTAFIAFNPFKNNEIVIITGSLLLLGFYVLLIWRGIEILLKKQFPISYMFLYLCTLEFLPLLLIYKLVIV